MTPICSNRSRGPAPQTAAPVVSDRLGRDGNRLRSRRRTLTRVILGLLLAAPAAAADNVWETYSSEVYNLAPLESFQLRIAFDQIPVRSWKLVVAGDRERCDLSVLRVRGESLLYYRNDESRHEVVVPWGRGEEVIIVVTNRRR